MGLYVLKNKEKGYFLYEMSCSEFGFSFHKETDIHKSTFYQSREAAQQILYIINKNLCLDSKKIQGCEIVKIEVTETKSKKEKK